MAPYIPSKTLENLSHFSDAAQRRQRMPQLQVTELCSAVGCGVTPGDTGDTGSDKIFTPLTPFATTLDQHSSLDTIAVPTQSGMPRVLITSVGPTNPSATISSSAVVCMTLAFVSVLLGLGAIALTRTRWYRRKKEDWDKFSWREGEKAELSTSPQITLQPPEVIIAESYLATILEDSEEDLDKGEDTSEESCFSEQTAGISPASSMTSIESESEEEEEEGVQVHRAQTQSVEIKRAVPVLISVPPK
ncbi:hypothetical protein HYPSUDRAFT_204220 [Hypholoma sublateritium FD-334 SS-4]|uniref:Uncharacterized protein n=1 Tax=Hypholoma sublateritium (strain FD-334 SS-4) TaxID=945553 RepID=A0A0D2NM61_HYPSF|nr:hypothetical protein HYPSUDRAFT_204220 [Hypholoma sublateritium FD-334 SS-4]